MAQSGYTPILIYASGTASNVPLAANMTSSASGAELALNYADGKLYYKNSSGVVTLLAGAGGAGIVAGSNTQVQYNNSGVFGASANMTFNGTTLTVTGLNNTGNTTLGDATSDTLTVNALVNSNLLFTDNTYDIGASGATRPRFIWSTNNHTVEKSVDPLFRAVGNSSTTTAGFLSTIDNGSNNWFEGARGDATGGTSGTQRWNLLYNSTNILYASQAGLVGVGQVPVDKLTVSGAVVSTSATVLNSSNTAAIIDWDASTSEGRLLAARSTGSMIGLWTNSSGGALLRRVYLDGLGRAKFSTDNSSGTGAPQAWATSQSVIELGGGGTWNASNVAGGTMSLTSNAYFNTSNAWIRRDTGYAARIDALGTDGSVVLQTASATGAGGSTITWDNSLTLNRNNNLNLTTTNATNGTSFNLYNPNPTQYTVVQLANTGTSGRTFQLGVGGNSASPANQIYIYDATAGATRMAINGSGQIGFGTINQGAFMHLYSPNADGSSMLIENGGTNDCGIRTKTTLGDWKFGTGIGTATNSFTIYDVGGASAQRFRIDGSGFTTIGTSTNAIAKLAVQVASSDGNLSDWGNGQFVVTRGTDTRGNGLGISYNDGDNSVYFSALQPALAWRGMKFRALDYQFYTTGSTSAFVIDNTYAQVVAPQRHAFFASNCQNSNQPSGTVLIFATAPTNQGARYSTVNGRFTAAVSGIYQFNHTTPTFNITNYFYGLLQINGVDKECIWHSPQNPGASAASDYETYCWSATVYLSAGDYVTVATKYNGGAPYVEGNRSTFSGHLVG